MSILSDLAPSLLSSAIAGGIGYLVARKKNESELRRMDVETENLELQTVHDVVNFWKNTVKDLRVEVDLLRLQVVAFRKENTDLKQEIRDLSAQISDLHKVVEKTPTKN